MVFAPHRYEWVLTHMTKELYPNHRELLNDETFWDLYREMYDQCGDEDVIRHQVGVDLGPMGSKGCVLESDDDWDNLDDEELEKWAETLVDAFYNEYQDFWENVPVQDRTFPNPIELRLKAILED